MNRLREVTGDLHRRLERRFDPVRDLADPARRPSIVRRYAALYNPAHTALAAELGEVDGLDFAVRSDAWRAVRPGGCVAETMTPFPEPADRWQALGFLYVVEGSTLGGRLILRELEARGFAGCGLSFLDPYGHASGRMWRSLLDVLEREGSRGPACLEGMCRGATSGFVHAERVLCGDPP